MGNAGRRRAGGSPASVDVDARLVAAASVLAADATTARVVAALDAAGVEVILLKGAAHRTLLGSQERVRGDVDLLLSPEANGKERRVLSSLGYRARPSFGAIPDERPPHGTEWVAGDGVVVDLHERIPGIGVSPAVAWQRLHVSAGRMQIGGQEVMVLGPTERALHVVLHAAQHGAGSERPVEDLVRLVDLLTQAELGRALRLARELDAEAPFEAGLRLVPEGRVVADAIGAISNIPTDVLVLAAAKPPMTTGISWLLELPSFRKQLAYVFRKTFPPPVWLRAWRPNWQPGRFGLAALYVWRPVWLMVHAPAAIRMFLRLRRRS